MLYLVLILCKLSQEEKIRVSSFWTARSVITGHVEVYGICQFPVFDISDRSEKDSKTFLFSFCAYMTPICIIFKSLLLNVYSCKIIPMMCSLWNTDLWLDAISNFLFWVQSCLTEKQPGISAIPSLFKDLKWWSIYL